MTIKFIKDLNKIKVSRLVWIPLAVAFAIILYHFKGYLVAATVNGEPISRVSVLTQLEKEGGNQILDNLITNTLILQEAKKEKVTVTSQEISDQINKISDNLKTSGQDLDSALAAQGMTRKDLEDQVKLQLLVQKMAGKDITVSDQEISDYFKTNSASYPKGTKLADVKDEISSTLKDQKLNDAITTWIQNIKTKAKINYFVNY
jgi:parvulin-like peptidyl-prolyl isomerase